MNEVTAPEKWQKSGKVRRVLTSHSIDNLFDYCPRKFELTTVYEMRPARESGYAASVGTALHEGVQAWLVGINDGMSRQSAIECGVWQFMLHFPWELEAEQKTHVRSFEASLNAFFEIINHPDWNGWELMQVEGKGWAIEVPFVIDHVSVGPVLNPYTGETLIFSTQGKIDFILRNKKTGWVKTRDLKTTVIQDQLIPSEYTFSGQQVGYSHVLHAMLGVAPSSFSVDYIVSQFRSGEPAKVSVLPFEKPADMIEDYWRTKIDRLKRMKGYLEQGWFPRTNGGCNSWGTECKFFDICRSRDYELIQKWFQGIAVEENTGYDWWVEMQL